MLVRREDKLEGNLKFSTWKDKILNILLLMLGTLISRRIKPNKRESFMILWKKIWCRLLLHWRLQMSASTLWPIFMRRRIPSIRDPWRTNFVVWRVEKDETIAFLFTNISQVRDQHMRIRVTINDDDLIQTDVNGIPYSLETILSTVNGQ